MALFIHNINVLDETNSFMMVHKIICEELLPIVHFMFCYNSIENIICQLFSCSGLK